MGMVVHRTTMPTVLLAHYDQSSLAQNQKTRKVGGGIGFEG